MFIKSRQIAQQMACYQDLIWNSIDGSTHPPSIENYDFRISKSKIRPRLMYLFKVSIFTTLDVYKAYFKSCHIRIQRPKDYFFSLWEAIAFVCLRVL